MPCLRVEYLVYARLHFLALRDDVYFRRFLKSYLLILRIIEMKCMLQKKVFRNFYAFSIYDTKDVVLIVFVSRFLIRSELKNGFINIQDKFLGIMKIEYNHFNK